ncbi:diacylglycerol kinase family protein [Galbitalea sp. SE-J8]|uniref:diacylglycerol kinase family protein n=1 Tax=Galbitalea sp. SE-J8 TaxID=3054952 RepID=UPI00259D1CFC|nr:diacylglycerol kinase family protein [Galbitalea sp. SE-J8]MDM4763656.1 diacylglycerol kinase family protein [Galbitalea sp. SE-J8]
MASDDPERPARRRVVVAINPAAAFGRHRAVGDAVAARLTDAGYEVTSLVRPDFTALLDASRAAIAERPDAFVVVGGDGMVNLAANAVAGTGVPFGIVPAGTGNDMARALGIPFESPEPAVDVLLAALAVLDEQEPLEIDAGLIRFSGADAVVQQRWFACALAAGFDALVNERANRMGWPKGPVRYVIALLVELARMKPVRYRIELDGEVVETSANLVSIGNGQSLGGGMKVTPDAMLDDGQLDVLIVTPMPRVRFLRIFPSVFSGTHVGDPHVTIRRAARIRLEADGMTAYADGERIAPLPIDVEVVPGALRVLAPRPVFDSRIVLAE